MVKSTDKAPRPGPGVRLEIQIANVVQNIVVVAGNTTNDEQLVLVQDSGMPSTTLGNGPMDLGLGPMSGL